MKVKTFAGSETAKVDKRVNDWLAKFGIKPHHKHRHRGGGQPQQCPRGDDLDARQHDPHPKI